MVFPDWVDVRDLRPDFCNRLKNIPFGKLKKKRVLDYLLRYFECNTHSLRYACINYLIYEKNLPLNTVAKLVGHVGLNQLHILSRKMLIKYLISKCNNYLLNSYYFRILIASSFLFGLIYDHQRLL